jgi:hypothetical protein
VKSECPAVSVSSDTNGFLRARLGSKGAERGWGDLNWTV